MQNVRPTKRVARGRTRANDPEGTRRRVLDAAAALFQDRGYAATGTQDIFDAAGVTSGAFYHHFAGKKDLGRLAADPRWSGELFAALHKQLARYPEVMMLEPTPRSSLGHGQRGR